MARQLARAAARLFARRGFEATSTREIVEEAGVAKPTLYYHFGSKEGLARALLVEPLEELSRKLERIVETAGDPVVALEGIMAAHFAFCREDPDRSRFFLAVAFGPPEAEVALLTECRKGALEKWTEAAFGRCVESGVLAAEDRETFATMYRGLLFMSVIEHLYHDKPLGEDRARVLVAGLLRGFEGARRSGPDHPR
ncbi:TetR/AcrR family transcriptional regulator [Paludisphaera soli]|uniref:TetR/AcrR family transcriptional regulator n=1 Tax=Paludisphaera soli TaxID=2712865 RepID=UPI0013EAA0BA|nr:TetR/AcrR family transcriptional regulator [Paludisphaera soli]